MEKRLQVGVIALYDDIPTLIACPKRLCGVVIAERLEPEVGRQKVVERCRRNVGL